MKWISRHRAHSHKSTLPSLSLTLLAVMTLSLPVFASTWDDIARLEQQKAGQSSPTQPKPDASSTQWSAGAGSSNPASHLLHLPSGLTVPAADWTVVLFMQSTCSYCQQFDPVLAQFSQQSGLPVFTYTLDGKGDGAFPKALPASPEVMSEFFGNGLPIATPTTFLVNVHTMATYPLLQGAVASDALLARLDEVFGFHYQQPQQHTQHNPEARYALP